MFESMFVAHPKRYAVRTDALIADLDATNACSYVCTMCIDACLAEDEVAELRRCIRTNLDCADICVTTARLLSRQTEPDVALIRAQLEVCVRACRACGDECAHHAKMHEHCRLCSEACRACEQSCNQLLDVLTA